MSSRSEWYLANAEKCQQYADAVDPFGTKRLYEELSRQWLRLAEQAEETGRIESSPTSAGLIPPREPQLTSLNIRRDMLDDLEREIASKTLFSHLHQKAPLRAGLKIRDQRLQ